MPPVFSKKKEQIFVIGIFRSGTSMVSSMLWNLGIPMRETSRTNQREDLQHGIKDGSYPVPKRGEEYSHYFQFECQDFYFINKEIYRRLGKDRFTIKADDYKNLAFEPDLIWLVKDYIRKRGLESNVWGVKDPRIVPLAKFWIKDLKHPKIIIVRRNKTSNIRSLVSREKVGEDLANLMVHYWGDMLNEFTDFVKGYLGEKELLEIDFDTAVDNPKETMGNIIDFLGLNFPKENIDKAIKYVSRKYTTF